MFLQLGHTKLEVFKVSKEFVIETYRLCMQFPSDEKFAMVQQIRRAALSVHLNIAEGSSRKTEADRRRFYEISRGALIEVDAAIGIAFDLNYVSNDEIENVGKLIVHMFKLLSGLVK